jgi:iron complex transport system ATP-binding protein
MGETVAALSEGTVRFGRRTILQSVSVRVERGAFWGVVGPNGAGKTTLLKALAGLVPLAAGSLELFGHTWRAVDGMPPSPVRRRIGVLWPPSDTNLDLPVRVRDVASFGSIACRGLGTRFGSAESAACEGALEDLGMGLLRDRLFRALSSGERQKVHLARLVAQQPELVLLDEPTAHLDLDWQERFTSLLDHLVTERKWTVAMVTHDIERLPASCDRLLLMREGRVVASGPRNEVLRSERLSELYGTPLEIFERDGRCAVLRRAAGS